MAQTKQEIRHAWDREHYDHIGAKVPKEKSQQFKKKCKEQGISQASVINKSIDEFLKG